MTKLMGLDRKNIIPTLKYMWLTTKHKYFVFCAGLRTGAPIWNLIVHDLSKYSLAEAPHYGRQFFGDQSDPLGFAKAWNHHQKYNKHHWEYWIPYTGHGRNSEYSERNSPLPMPEKYIREMIADWMGATRAYSGFIPSCQENWVWLQKDFYGDYMDLHPDTRKRCQQILAGVVPYYQSC